MLNMISGFSIEMDCLTEYCRALRNVCVYISLTYMRYVYIAPVYDNKLTQISFHRLALICKHTCYMHVRIFVKLPILVLLSITIGHLPLEKGKWLPPK